MLARTLQGAAVAVKSSPYALLNVGWAVVIVTLLLFALESFVGAPDRDSSAFIYVAKGILEGEVPYADRWDHKGPLIYLLNALGLALLGMWGIWLMEAMFLLGAVWLAYTIVREQFGFAATPFPVAVLLGCVLHFGVGNHVELYALLFQFLTLYLFMRIEKGNIERVNYALFLVSIGALAAATFLLRPNLIGLWIAIGIYWVFIDRDDAVKRVVWAAMSATLAFILVVGAFGSVGRLSEFWDAVFIYNFAYSDTSVLERLKAIWKVWGLRFTPVLLPIIASYCAALYCFRSSEDRRERFRGVLKLSTIALPIEIFLVSVSARDYGHYYLTMLPAVVMLMAFFAYGAARVVSLPASLLGTILLILVTDVTHREV